jgi:hypothetical protein
VPALTFTRVTQAHDETTDVVTPTVTTVTGNAIVVSGRPQRYAALGLVLSTMPTLFFSPTNYNQRAFTTESIQPGDSVEFNGAKYSVKDVEYLAPDGVVIAARVVIAKSK